MQHSSRGRYLSLIFLVVLLAVFMAKKGGLTGDRHNQNPTGNSVLNRDPSRLIYSKHARCRMNCRHIDDSEVREILEEGSLNQSKSDPEGRPDPKFAFEGRTHDGQHVRIVFAASGNRTVVVTVIDLDQDIPCSCP